MTLLYPNCKQLWLLGLLLLGLCFTARATHIVGGELELQYRGPNATTTHRINLNLYFDAINGNQGAKDAIIYVGVFRKRDNALLGYVALNHILSQDTYVAYTKPACSISTLSTQLLHYTADVTFLQADFSDAGGYYLTWERCCRNNAITNIALPGSAGSTFYLEFPSPWLNGKAYANSSPVFGQAKGDYACIKKPFSFDFSAKDPDGDSLVYSLVTPYNGFSSPQVPNPGSPNQNTGQSIFYPGPYPGINWLSGYSASNAIPGSQPLRIDPKTGRLSVTADRIGLFVFSVLVEERRNGQVIGRVRRDFQLKVIDCPANDPPVVLLRPAGQSAFYKEGTVLTINEKDKNCLTVYITDTEANQTLSLTTIGASLPGLTLTPGTFTTRTTHDTLAATVCFGKCAADKNGRVTLQIVAADAGCPQPLMDTLNVQLNIIPDPNNKPTVTTNLTPKPQTIELNLVPGDTAASSVHFTVFGNDADRDSLTLYAVGRGFDYTKLGMKFATKNGRPTLQSPFNWVATCDLLQGKNEATFTLDFIDDDHNCHPNHTDTTTVTIHVKTAVANYEITVPNVFTPNNDGYNDYFAARNLPLDNCTDQFRSVEIVNRWGRRVFSSTDRNFRWYGEEFPAGEYLYAIEFTQHTYKGHVTLIR